MPKRKEFIKLIAEKYTWTCSKCNQSHVIFKVLDEVRCTRCGEEFKVTVSIHSLAEEVMKDAFGSGKEFEHLHS
jgi:DNA-directed RNA polymerase subunit RPC12/RpoP